MRQDGPRGVATLREPCDACEHAHLALLPSVILACAALVRVGMEQTECSGALGAHHLGICGVRPEDDGVAVRALPRVAVALQHDHAFERRRGGGRRILFHECIRKPCRAAPLADRAEARHGLLHGALADHGLHVRVEALSTAAVHARRAADLPTKRAGLLADRALEAAGCRYGHDRAIGQVANAKGPIGLLCNSSIASRNRLRGGQV